MEKLNIMVVDDTIVYRRILSDAVDATGLGNVIRSASNGIIALDWLKQYRTDVILLDVFMPEMNGIDTLKAVKRDYPDVAVIMISSGASDSAAMTLEALKLGAMDFILKPSDSDPQKNMDMIKTHLKVLFTQIMIKKYSNMTTTFKNKILSSSGTRPHADTPIPVEKKISGSSPWNGADLVLIASSTGGPNALDAVLTGIPGDFNKPILVVQHMPPDFTKIMSQSLNRKCGLNVIEGEEGLPIEKGRVIIAPGGFHMTVRPSGHREKVIHLEKTPYVNGVRPAADILFSSVSTMYGSASILSVILTGMGSDGMKGVLELKEKCNCYCIAQSEKTCVVYGMPRSVVEAGLSDEVSDLGEISGRIQQIASGRS
ncbi:MAG: chemotaxis-specific protein-glutamate methyltransferase CheB [Clostridia bacterium]|nr:chemotaxis-specific protein-glutamate methyltransferase CheB [Clostridia bacterium]